MKTIIECIDLTKYEKTLNDLVDNIVDDIFNAVKEQQDKNDIPIDMSIAITKNLLLRTSITISDSVKWKFLSIIDEADKNFFEGLKKC